MPTPEIFGSQPPFPDNIPTCNLARLSYGKLLAGDKDESNKLFQACIDTGFFLLDLRDKTEGEELLRDAEGLYKLNQEFTALDDSEKSKYRINGKHQIFGWKAIGALKIEDGKSDRCEFYSISQDGILDTVAHRAQAHPLPVESSKELLTSFIMHSHDICEMLFSHLDSFLGIPIGKLASMHSTAKQSMTTVRLIHMPPQLQDQRASLFGHTDNGSITILFNVVGGLQILPPGLPNEEENWRWFRPEPGFAVVNLGDALVQWSGGLLRSNMHRVVNPPGLQSASDRYSFAYVLKPDNEASMQRLVRADAKQLQDTNDQCTYDDWLVVKSAASREGRNLIRISATS